MCLSDDSALTRSAQSEMVRGIDGMLDRKLRVESTPFQADGAFVLGTVTEFADEVSPLEAGVPQIGPEGYAAGDAAVSMVIPTG